MRSRSGEETGMRMIGNVRQSEGFARFAIPAESQRFWKAQEQRQPSLMYAPDVRTGETSEECHRRDVTDEG